jgi:hypothetical protein
MTAITPNQMNSLLIMLVMGIATVYGVAALAKHFYGVEYLESFVLQSHFGLGVKGDIITLSLAYVPLMMFTIYLRDQGIGKSVLKLRTPYNVVMTLFSFYSFATMAMWRFSPTFPGEAHNSCLTALESTMVINGVTIGSFRSTIALFYWSKYIEWIDSVFLLYDGKPISILHGYHHLGAPIALGIMHYSQAEFVWIFVMWNGLIHTVMYFYFGCSGVGIKLKLLRPFITSLQIAQFVTGMSYLYYAYNGSTLPGGACDAPGKTYSYLYQFAYVTIVLGLFTNFFISQYVGKPKKGKEKKN